MRAVVINAYVHGLQQVCMSYREADTGGQYSRRSALACRSTFLTCSSSVVEVVLVREKLANRNSEILCETRRDDEVRPFLTQWDLSVENGIFRLRAKSGKGLFRLTFFRLSFPPGGSTRKSKLFQSKKYYFLTGSPPVEKLSRKSFTGAFLARRIDHPTTKHTPTCPHTHTSTHPHQVPHSTASNKALTLSLLLLLAASHRGAFRAPLPSSVYHTTAAARGIDPILPTTATPAVALAALG